jgi:hypothetical protein
VVRGVKVHVRHQTPSACRPIFSRLSDFLHPSKSHARRAFSLRGFQYKFYRRGHCHHNQQQEASKNKKQRSRDRDDDEQSKNLSSRLSPPVIIGSGDLLSSKLPFLTVQNQSESLPNTKRQQGTSSLALVIKIDERIRSCQDEPTELNSLRRRSLRRCQKPNSVVYLQDGPWPLMYVIISCSYLCCYTFVSRIRSDLFSHASPD